MVEKVTELDEAIKSMKEEYGRKVSVDEDGRTSRNQ